MEAGWEGPEKVMQWAKGAPKPPVRGLRFGGLCLVAPWTYWKLLWICPWRGRERAWLHLQGDTYPDVLGLQFSWDGFYEEAGSAFIGCGPGFEFGLYTSCFIARPGRACHLSLGGYSLSIQTYSWTKSTYGNGKKYVAAAYVISP
ncbi:uridylate-specific endoribonuclease-like isoform 1-T2 [Podargus strigoides]